MQTPQSIGEQAASKTARNDRLENVAWGVFLMVMGATWLSPGIDVTVGVWMIAAGLIMLLLNAVRYLWGIMTSSFTIGLGAVALVAGTASAFSVKVFGVLLIAIGVSIILRPLLKKA